MARPRKQVDVAEVLRLRTAGHSLREIASELRLGRGTVHRVLKRTLERAMASQNPKSDIPTSLPDDRAA
jgi:DNA invertase Pin-like site-specific DNA recombinase